MGEHARQDVRTEQDDPQRKEQHRRDQENMLNSFNKIIASQGGADIAGLCRLHRAEIKSDLYLAHHQNAGPGQQGNPPGQPMGRICEVNERQGEEHDEQRAHPLKPTAQDDAVVVPDDKIAQLRSRIIGRRSRVDDKRCNEDHGADDPGERGQNTRFIY